MPNDRDEPGSHAASNANNKHLKQKRARSQLSCAPCRTGKLKCNRAHEPACDQCIKRSRESSCIYLPPPVKHKPTQNVKGRIRQLESLVVDLMNNTSRSSSDGNKTVQTANERTGEQDKDPFSQPTPPSDSDNSPNATDRGNKSILTPPDDVDSTSPLFGQMKISKDEISYVGEAHWGAILNSISELKRELSDEEPDDDKVDDEHEDDDEDLPSERVIPSDSDNSPNATDRGNKSILTPPDDVDSTSPLFGQMKISKDEISYVGEAHWGAILNSISELKRELSDEEPDDDKVDDEHEDDDEDLPSERVTKTLHGIGPMHTPQQFSVHGLGFLLGNNGAVMTKEQLIASVPEKKVVDRLLSLWFNSADPFKPIIHAPTFQDEYRQFWKSPKSTPTMWLGLLFSILSLATSFGLRDCDRSSPQAQSILSRFCRFHSLAASAAVLADYTKPKEYTLECLVLYASGLRSDNAFVSVWLMVGLVIRLALRMGYHRDASHYPEISAFRGEMRRRLWAIVHMIDVLISFQLGLPSMVRTIQFDTQPPHNLLDRDFNVNTKILPPGREVHELTPSSYTRAKFRMVHIFANAAELSHATTPPAYEEMMTLDDALETAKAAIPPLLRMPETAELVTDPAEQLMCRFNLDLLYLKTKLTLHRRYQKLPLEQLSHDEQCAGLGTSRKVCTEMALRVLSHHHTIYSASQPGGQLESVKWYMGSISTHDFLLAAMIICLELSLQIETGDRSGVIVNCPHRASMMQALEQSQMIWSEASGRTKGDCGIRTTDAHTKGEHMFDETEKASHAMVVMIRKVKAKFGAAAMGGVSKQGDPSQSNISNPMSTEQSHTFNAQGRRNPVNMPGQSSWDTSQEISQDHEDGSITADLKQNDRTATNNFAPFDSNLMQIPDQDFNDLEYSMIDQMLDPSLPSLDWEMWDQQIGTGQPSTPWAQANLSDHPTSNHEYTEHLFSSGLFSRAVPRGEMALNFNGYTGPNVDLTGQVGSGVAGDVEVGAFAALDAEMSNGGSFVDTGDWGGNLLNGNGGGTQNKVGGISGLPQNAADTGDLDMGFPQHALFDPSGTGHAF
nr:transcription factor lepe [Quercus suber]